LHAAGRLAQAAVVAESWFLKIDGIDGESTNELHKGEIEVDSWSWGVTQTRAGAGGGGGSGRPEFRDFTFVARVSKASPKLFLACAQGSHLKSALLSGSQMRGQSGKRDEFLKYRLADVLVTSFQQGDTGGDAAATDQFSLDYGKIEISYTPVSPSGTPEPPVQAGFDVRSVRKA
jgi:type VI secretion system secreted protein Hcp